MRTMMQRAKFALLLLALCTSAHIASLQPAQAHHRDFTLSRDWYLPYKGEKEIESRAQWFTRTGEMSQKFEFEYGITENFAIEPGIEFHRDPGGGFKFDGNDIELRFNFGKFRTGRILPALNFEFEKPVDQPWRGEVKFIFSLYGNDGSDLSANINVGRGLGTGPMTEGEITLGYVRPLGRTNKTNSEEDAGNSVWRGGLEFVHDFQMHNVGLGPVLVYRANKNLNILGTYLFGINHGRDNSHLLHIIGEYEF